jgi:hypothetical protein
MAFTQRNMGRWSSRLPKLVPRLNVPQLNPRRVLLLEPRSTILGARAAGFAGRRRLLPTIPRTFPSSQLQSRKDEMKTLPDGTLLVQAAEEFGGFERVDSSFGLVKGLKATIFGGMDMSGKPAGSPPGATAWGAVANTTRQQQDLISAKQKRIHAAIAKVRQGNSMSFQSAWQHVQGTHPELFQGLETTVVHPD